MRSSPSFPSNRAPILDAFGTRLGKARSVLEIGSGGGEHAVWFARRLPAVAWQPTEIDPEALAAIEVRRREACLPNLLPALHLDASAPGTWPPDGTDAVLAVNLLHIAPWSTTLGLVAGSAVALRPSGLLFVYGPFVGAGVEATPGNAAFDADLRQRDPAWGLRDLDAVAAAAAAGGLVLEDCIPMPSNNRSLVFRRRGIA